VETLNEKLTKGAPFETKFLRMIDNVEVSEKMLTLVIEDKPEIMTRKATVEEVLDEDTVHLAQ
jgi:hypothetical protein